MGRGWERIGGVWERTGRGRRGWDEVKNRLFGFNPAINHEISLL